MIFAIFHAFAIWGAIFFEKLHFIKTAFVFFIYLIFSIIINDPLLHLVTDVKDLHGKAYGSAFYIEGKNYFYINPTDSMMNTNLVMLAIVVVLFWASAFFRLKEKEI
ncbi:hypothetical protein [Mucilaginibacter sp.]|uniref:hypothetical protein n=1 Tax=Mucilaginibacter sp. TaxID=1882438 RepID=UPI0026053E07|nr:hypothetical protein [Mucilaginibacter sp.]